MIKRLVKTAALFAFIAVLTGCKELPLPPEAMEACSQEHTLWRYGAETYAPKEYTAYKSGLNKAKKHLTKESNKFRLFRDYEAVQSEFRIVLAKGELVLKKVRGRKDELSKELSGKKTFYQKKTEALRQLSSLLNEGRLACRSLIKAEVLLKEIELNIVNEKYIDAEKGLKQVPVYTSEATNAIYPIFNRYADRNQIAKWKGWVRDTIQESGKTGNYSIIVSKLDRELILYRAGKPYRKYEINIGINGSRDKLYAGDRATPEGRYKIIKKLPKSKYHKALLINYPNEEDRRNFAIAKKKGLVPKNTGIGGLIEIHGGGMQGMTYGCIALESMHMDELFSMVETGTPIIIVGAIEHENSISSAINNL